MIAVIDYGMGNIHSIKKALEVCGGRAIVTNKPSELARCSKLVLPGVGAFSDAMEELRARGLAKAINNEVNAGKIFLGICLGMQLLFEKSEEAPGVKGLGLLKGKVIKFKAKKNFPVPQMGWNSLSVLSRPCPLLKGVKTGSYVYFCHSFFPAPVDKKVIAASSNYGADFAAVVWKDNIYGSQFHPEKSQLTGIQMLKNFVKL